MGSIKGIVRNRNLTVFRTIKYTTGKVTNTIKSDTPTVQRCTHDGVKKRPTPVAIAVNKTNIWVAKDEIHFPVNTYLRPSTAIPKESQCSHPPAIHAERKTITAKYPPL